MPDMMPRIIAIIMIISLLTAMLLLLSFHKGRKKIDHAGTCPSHIELNGRRVALDIDLSIDSCQYLEAKDPNHIWFADIPLSK